MLHGSMLRHPFSLRRLAPLAILIAAGVGFVIAGGHHYLTFSTLAQNHAFLKNWVAHWGLAAAAAYTAVYFAVAALSVPGGAILTVAGGFLLGTSIGGLCALVGATAGAGCIFLAARAGLGGVAQGAGPFFGKLQAEFRADAFHYLLFLRLVPLFPFWIVNLVPALAGMRLPTFLLATLIGLIPGTFIYASLGNALSAIVDQPDMGIVFKPNVLVPIAALSLLALFPVWYRRRQRRSGQCTGS